MKLTVGTMAQVRHIARLVALGKGPVRIAQELGLASRTVSYILADPRCEEEVRKLLDATDEFVHEKLLEGERHAAATLKEALDATQEDGTPNWDVRLKAAIRFLDSAGRRGRPVERVESQEVQLTGDAAALALANALRDPGVRTWLDAHPQTKQQLLAPPEPSNGKQPTPAAKS
jgi:hypothetical protein